MATVQLKRKFSPQIRHCFRHRFPAGKEVEVPDSIAKEFVGDEDYVVKGLKSPKAEQGEESKKATK